MTEPARDPSWRRSGGIAQGFAWSSVGRIGSQVAQFAASLVLARLLAPEQFGLVASIQVFSQFAVLFFELGMGNALVQAKTLRAEDLDTVFWLNALGGVVFVVLLAAAAPVLAAFYDEPELRTLVPVVACSFLANVGVCHLALLQRSMAFRSIAVAEIVGATVGFTVAIVGAALGMGAYALAIGPIAKQSVNSALLWRSVRWRPQGWIRREAARRVWAFSRGLLGFNVVNYWGRNADNLVIGKVSGVADLGFYNRSYNFMLLPVQQISQVMGRVMLPALSELQDQHAEARRVYRRSLQGANLLAVPILAGVAVTAPALVPTVWGDQWTPMVPLLSLLCVAGIPQCLATSVGWIYQSQHRTGLMFVVGLLASIVGVVAIVSGALIAGATGVAVAVAVHAWITTAPSLFIAGRIIGLRLMDVLKDALPTLATTGLMAAAMWVSPATVDLGRASVEALLLQIVVGAVTFGACALLLLRPIVMALLRRLRRRS